jgi:hypothetical protein
MGAALWAGILVKEDGQTAHAETQKHINQATIAGFLCA